MEDPRAAYSYRSIPGGEWAHPRHAGPLEDAFTTYVDPAWERLAPRLAAAPQGPPGAARPWIVLVIGFGRGFETIALLRRLRAEAPAARVRILGLEPHPERLAPWPPRWPDLRADEAPWWGGSVRACSEADGGRSVVIETATAGAWLAAAEPASVDGVLLDLFSPAGAPQDWEPGLWPGLERAAAPGAILTSYTCARSVREGLAGAGWEVEVLRRPGHRDTLRAHRLAASPP